jgi:hypothetical protein
MVCSFITSAEYQQRFSPIASRTNGECDRLPSSLASRSLMIKYLILLSPANLLSLKVFSIWLGFSKHWEL